MNNLTESTEQEIINAQVNSSASLEKLQSNKLLMEEVKTDGSPVTKETKLTEQSSDAQATVSASLTEPAVKLAIGVIYNLSRLMSMGFTFGRLAINRDVNDPAVKAKMKSIVASCGVISPCLVCFARQCLEANLSVVRLDGSEVTISDPDVDMILVILDGQHRDEAVKRLNSKLKKGETRYECFYYLPLNPSPSIIDILREANVATKPWKGGDFLTNLIVSAPDKVDCEMLLWVQARYGQCGDVASWLWATLDPSRIYLKSMLVKASKSESELIKIADKTDFKFGKMIYEAAQPKLSDSLVKLKVVPQTVISLMKKLTASISKQEATDKIVAFFKSLTEDQVKELKACKRDETSSKDQQIESKLLGFWESFNLKG